MLKYSFYRIKLSFFQPFPALKVVNNESMSFEKVNFAS